MLVDVDRVQAQASHSSCKDHLDRLPDELVSVILSKIGDVKALGRCCTVSKRLQALAMQVDNVVVKVDLVIAGEGSSSLRMKGNTLPSSIFKLFLWIVARLLQAVQNWVAPRKSGAAQQQQVVHHSPRDVLKNFKAIQHLKLDLPAGELGVEKGALLKWRAEFGSSLEKCTILAASSCEIKASSLGKNISEDGDILPEDFYTDGGLKLRVVWTISSLIAASARHFLLRQIVSDHPCLKSLVLGDADGQGLLYMSQGQLREFCEKPCVSSPSSSRTQVPALSLRLCYAANLDLAGGMSLQGATLVMIKPVDQPPCCKDPDSLVPQDFEEPYRSAVTSLIKKKAYVLEMNSF